MRNAVIGGVLAGLLVVTIAGALLLSRLPLPTAGGIHITAPPSVVPAGTTATAPQTILPSPAAVPSPGPSEAVTATPEPGGSDGLTQAPSSGERGLAIGQQAPPLRVETLDGGTVDLTELSGGPVWVTFMATYCPSCQEELPLMQRMKVGFGDSLEIVIIDIREDRQTVESYMEALGIELPVGLDLDGTAQRAWGAFALPVHYWVDDAGIVREFLFGSASPEAFLEGVRTVLPDASFTP